ncbi:MAG TPA: DUF72 domain-containing protein [Candidatus Acidoferrales bacterium]|jgi:uncharacterized protein YecE (DUF72 family)
MSAGKIYAGTSGWAYASWKPDFYPAKLSSKKFLEYYASRLNSVEVNYTFRSIPTEKLLSGWIETTPSEFKFAIKAHQSITHFKRLRDATGVTTEFMDSLQPLRKAKKLGPVLFQLRGDFKCDVPLLKDFLKGLPRGTQATFEFRNVSWFCDEVYEALRKSNVALCLAESDDLETPNVATADFSYLRLRKPNYSVKAREVIAEKVAGLTQKGEVFAYFKHEDTPDGAVYAEDLLKSTSNH